MIVLPKIKENGLHGVHRGAKGYWVIRWTEEGKPRTKAAGTKDEAQAKRARDHLYTKLRDRGALTLGTPEHAQRGDLYIYEQPPYIVKVPGCKAVPCESLRQAREVRNHLVQEKATPGGSHD